MRNLVLVAQAAAASMANFGSALAAAASINTGHHMGRTKYAKGHGPRGRGTHPIWNLRTRLPHTHDREIARRLRQADRVRDNQVERLAKTAGPDARPGYGLTRRGRLVPVTLAAILGDVLAANDDAGMIQAAE